MTQMFRHTVKRALLVLALLSGLVAAPGFAMAQGSATDQVIGQLAAQGYTHVTKSRTWLGRVRLVARGQKLQREIVLNPNTGEILRDEVRPLLGTGQPRATIGNYPDRDDSDSSGSAQTDEDNSQSESSDASSTSDDQANDQSDDNSDDSSDDNASSDDDGGDDKSESADKEDDTEDKSDSGNDDKGDDDKEDDEEDD